MMGRVFATVAGWLVPDDERGVALIGDWCETHATWRAEHGATRATCLLLIDLARSLPGLALAALAERGWRRCILRSIPGLVVGYGVFALVAALAGGVTHAPEPRATLMATVVVGLLSAACGWIAAAIAGDAPRQHGLLVGLGLAVSGAVVADRGAVDLGMMVLPFLVVIVVAASFGGACHRVKPPRNGHATA